MKKIILILLSCILILFFLNILIFLLEDINYKNLKNDLYYCQVSKARYEMLTDRGFFTNEEK